MVIFLHLFFLVVFFPPSAALYRLLCLQVAGIKGVFLSNKVVENQVRTYITYNKGRDWRLLRAPTTDLQGNKVYCEQVSGPLTPHVFDYSNFHCLLKNTPPVFTSTWSEDKYLYRDLFYKCVSFKFVIFFTFSFGNLILRVSQPYCSLHLHLHVSENPYTSGNIVSEDSAPGVIIASGEMIWFVHPYCCLLRWSLIVPLHVFLNTVKKKVCLIWPQFAKSTVFIFAWLK